MQPSRSTLFAVLAATAALGMSACGSSGDPGPSTPAGPTVLVPPPGTILSANSTQQLGTVVVDGGLNTLYRFDRDDASPSTSACVDACTAAWPPVLTDPSIKPVLEGVAADAVGTLVRPDGSTQVTIGGWPVYRHAGDSAPAATDGNGVDGVWFAIAPDGQKATAPPVDGN